MVIGELAAGASSGMSKKLKLDDSVEKSVGDNLPSLAEREKEVRNAMAKWFIHDGINPSITKHPSFSKLLSCLNLISPPSLSEVEKEILEVHEEYKEKAKKFLRGYEGQLTFSYEWMVLGWGWERDYIKGPILHEDFVCLTAHFVDDNWKIKQWILGFTTDPSVPLEDIYIYPFRNAVQDFGIENKVSTLLLPNNEGFDEETLDPLRKWIEDKGNNQINPRILLLYCCSDLFQLMVDDLFSELSWSLLDDVRMLVGWGRCSSTNWNVSLYHLQQAVAMKAEDAFSKDEIYDDYDKPSDEDWTKIQTFCKLADCIYKVAKELFEGAYSTSNVYFYLLSELKVILNQELASADNDYFLRKAKQILKRFDKYWNKMFLILATASVLDPRFKMKYLDFYCSKNKNNDDGSKAETVLDYLRDLYARYAASDIGQKPICPDTTIDSDSEEEDHDEEEEKEQDKEDVKPDPHEDFVLFQEYLKFEGSPRELHESELDSYLKETVMEWNKDFNALEWWKVESPKYPILSRVARDILSIPISRATSWDAFVADRKEPPEFVVSMEPKVSNAMMCSKEWLRLRHFSS